MAEQQIQSPEERAEAAARDLADRGKTATARAVREAAGVSMTVAAAAAKAWREAAAERGEVEIPQVPADVSARLSAVWADAYRAAVAVVSPERDRLAAEVDELRAEVEAERDDAAGQLEAARTEQHEIEEQLRQTSRSLSTREATITELRGQNQTLAGQLDALIARIPEEGGKKAE